jgi:hypothetical protein
MPEVREGSKRAASQRAEIMDAQKPIRVEATPGSASDGFYLDRGQELRKQTIPLLNDILTKLIVLNTALLGVFVGIKEVPVTLAMRILTIACFIVSLAVAFFGVYPKQWSIVLDDPKDIRTKEDAGIARKSCLLKVAASFLIAGFVCGLVGFIVGATF